MHPNGGDYQMFKSFCQGARSFKAPSRDEMHNLAGTRCRKRPEDLFLSR
jgi:hypothetical protein